jgi:hypothetical protein
VYAEFFIFIASAFEDIVPYPNVLMSLFFKKIRALECSCEKLGDNEWLCKGHKAYVLSFMHISRGLFFS